MAPVARKSVAVAPKTGGSIAFMDRGFYTGGSGFDLPAGEYAMEFTTQMYQPTRANGSPAGEPFLAVVITAHPLKGGEPVEKVLSVGSKASLSFTPSPDGKGLNPIPGGPASTLNNQSNWALFVKSLWDCGLPEGVGANDFSEIDGIWVRTDNVDEPESRKSMQARTGEAAETVKRGPNKIPQVVEILDEGKPWEGTGGFDNLGAAAAPAKTAPKTAAKVAPKVAGKKVAPVLDVEPEASDDDVEAAALNGVGAVLEQEKNANGCTKVALRVGTFNHVKSAMGDDMAQAVLNTYFGSDETLNAILSTLGYVAQAGQIKVA